MLMMKSKTDEEKQEMERSSKNQTYKDKDIVERVRIILGKE